jgi:integrase
MFLSKRSNGFYYIFYENQNGKRTCKSTKTKIKREAYKYLNSFSTQYEKQIQIQELTLNEFIFKYLKYSEIHHTPKTTLTYQTTFNALLNYSGNKIISNIKEIELHEFIQKRINTVSLHAGRKDLINIKASFNWAVKMNLLIKNPASNLKRVKKPEKQPLFFSKDEFAELVEVIDNPDIKAIVILAVNTGMRQMEILTLRWDQINLTDSYLVLNNQNHITKSKRVRTIPLNETCIKLLEEIPRLIISEFVFHYNGSQMKQDFLVKNFKRYIKKTNLNCKLNFHSLRHTFASWLVQKGVSIYHISKLLGHADIKTTEIYSHLRTDDLSEAVKMLD